MRTQNFHVDSQEPLEYTDGLAGAVRTDHWELFSTIFATIKITWDAERETFAGNAHIRGQK